MDTARYIVALVLLVGFPPGILLWFLIHPFAAFWRRLGPVWTYIIVSVPALSVSAALLLVRRRLLAVEYGTTYLLIALAVVSLAGTIVIALKRRKHLTARILAGIPELSSDDPGRLLTEGIYARIRHPRYVEALLGVLAYALFANYLATYVLVLISVPAIYLIVILEERELSQRFGAEYEAYRKRVPMFIPGATTGSSRPES
jgi:protein-S-isoprenylcysteine O-methyltransferase Ste14